jgi:hypothetical protein
VIASFDYVSAEPQLVHVMEVVEIVRLDHVAVFVYQEPRWIHFADVNLARRLRERNHGNIQNQNYR